MRKAAFNSSFQVPPSISFYSTAVRQSNPARPRQQQQPRVYVANPGPYCNAWQGKAFLYVFMCSGHLLSLLLSLAPGVIFVSLVAKASSGGERTNWEAED